MAYSKNLNFKRVNKSDKAQGLGFPWHGWMLGGIMCLYSLAAAFDYTMSFVVAEDYYRGSGMTEAQITYFFECPDLGCDWMDAFRLVRFIRITWFTFPQPFCHSVVFNFSWR